MKKEMSYFLVFISVLILADSVYRNNKKTADLTGEEITTAIIVFYDKMAISGEFEKFKIIFAQELKKGMKIEGDNLPDGRYRVYVNERKSEGDPLDKRIVVLLKEEKVCEREISELKTWGNIELFAKNSVSKLFYIIRNLKKDTEPVFDFRRQTTPV